jgi:uncharacterized membrane protein (UPF0127 family)
MADMLPALLLVTLLTLVPACTEDPPTPAVAPGAITEVVFHAAEGDRSLFVRVADSPDERAQGLMGVGRLAADEGMAFDFDGVSSAPFWMKDTLIPLSIAFVGQDGRIIAIEEMAPCRADPCPTYSAREPYTLAIEANAGWFREHGVHEGDRCSVPEAA